MNFMDALERREVLVDVSGAGVRRDGRWLVEGVDLAIRSGEIVTMIGPNGSGKSTTAKLVTGVLKPDVGSVSRKAQPSLKERMMMLIAGWLMVGPASSLPGLPASRSMVGRNAGLRPGA